MSEPAPSPIYLQIAESIRRQILSGDLPPGSRIPPVRSAAREWNCTPGTVNRAYRELAREGLIIGRPGKGTVVAELFSSASPPPLGWAALVHRGESFLLEAMQGGFSLPAGEVAVAMAAARLRETLDQEASLRDHPDMGPTPDLHFVGSHDLLIEVLARQMAAGDPPLALSLNYTGSLGGLIALARDEADICGVHLWDEETQSYNAPFVLRVLPGRRFLLLTLAHRHLGLILPPGNPQQIRALPDLANPEVRFLNRQPGSGTRVWLDRQLPSSHIDPDEIPGYNRCERTHTAVARAVSVGEATAGFGLQAAAAQFGLDFIPLACEPYELVIPETLAGETTGQALIDEVQAPGVKQAIQLLGGYEADLTGSMRWIG